MRIHPCAAVYVENLQLTFYTAGRMNGELRFPIDGYLIRLEFSIHTGMLARFDLNISTGL